jgi:hypothetical protein
MGRRHDPTSQAEASTRQLVRDERVHDEGCDANGHNTAGPKRREPKEFSGHVSDIRRPL